MTTISILRRKLNQSHQKLQRGGWRLVGAEFGISGGMAYRIAVDGYEPKEPHIRLKLGLPALAPAPVCVKCGQVHTTKRCTNQPRRYRRLDDYPVDMLREMLANRQEMKWHIQFVQDVQKSSSSLMN